MTIIKVCPKCYRDIWKCVCYNKQKPVDVKFKKEDNIVEELFDKLFGKK